MVQNRAHSVPIQNFLRSLVAQRRRLRSGSIRCHHRKVDFGRPGHALRRVHMDKITPTKPLKPNMHYALTMSSRCFASPRARDQLPHCAHSTTMQSASQPTIAMVARSCGYVYDGPHSMHAIIPETGRGIPGTMSTNTPSSHAASKTSDARMYASQK